MSPPARSLDPAWLQPIDRVARRVLGPRDRTGDALARAVRQVSEAYTRRAGTPAQLDAEPGALAARLRFFLPRDLPKIGAPLRELAWANAIPSRRPIRLLDLGAGLGSTCLGVLAALAELDLGTEAALEITAADADPEVLSILAALWAELERSALGRSLPRATLRTVRLDLHRPAELPRGPFDLITAGLVLNELGSADEGGDAEGPALALVRALLQRLSDDGSLLVLEPALAVSARALQGLRDRLLETREADSDVCVFAPCLHHARCPLLARERDWCHEDEPWTLPEPLVAVARAAGLRWEGLTFSYLTLRRDGRTLASAMAGRSVGLDPPVALGRVVSAPRASKGKVELDVCGAGARSVLVELTRDVGRRSALAAFGRGDVLWLGAPPGTERVRLGPGVGPVRARPSGSAGPLRRVRSAC